MTVPTGFNKEISTHDTKLPITISTDGTTTTVTVSTYTIVPWVGGGTSRGVARRRKGEPRNARAGRALALHRAFQQLADEYGKQAEELLR
jgi:hypothetical protein